MNDISTNLKNLRARSKLSQAAVANSIGVAQPTVGRWELGVPIPSDVIVSLIRVLGCRLDDLFYGTDQSNQSIPVSPTIIPSTPKQGCPLPVLNRKELLTLHQLGITPSLAKSNLIDFKLINLKHKSSFIFKEDTLDQYPEISSGDYLLIQPDKHIKPNTYSLYLLDDQPRIILACQDGLSLSFSNSFDDSHDGTLLVSENLIGHVVGVIPKWLANQYINESV